MLEQAPVTLLALLTDHGQPALTLVLRKLQERSSGARHELFHFSPLRGDAVPAGLLAGTTPCRRRFSVRSAALSVQYVGMDDEASLLEAVAQLSTRFASEQGARQGRRSLDQRDFEALAATGFPLLALPEELGGCWSGAARSVRPITRALRVLAHGDSSVALVASMHPAVLSYWLTAPMEERTPAFLAQLEEIAAGVKAGAWWGTITSEPGSGGDIERTRAVATPAGLPLAYRLTGEKHFGSGSGVTSFMVTSAVPDGEKGADWFFIDVRDIPWDGSRGVTLVSEWDGHGMTATQSHGFRFEGFPATRMASQGRFLEISQRAGGFIGCLFTSVVVGVVDAAMAAARLRLLQGSTLPPYEHEQWLTAANEAWIIDQCLEGMLRAVEEGRTPRLAVAHGKLAVAELSERLLTRLSRIMGGASYSRRSPFGHWLADVRALGFLRPPWGLARRGLARLLAQEEAAAAGEPDVD